MSGQALGSDFFIIEAEATSYYVKLEFKSSTSFKVGEQALSNEPINILTRDEQYYFQRILKKDEEVRNTSM